MEHCPACGARLVPGAGWCGQCYAAVVPAFAGAPEPVAAPAGTGRAPLDPAWRAVFQTSLLVVVAIGLGAVMQWFIGQVGNRPRLEPDQLIRWSLFATTAFYVCVGGGLLVFLHRSGRRLTWHTGAPVASVSLGLITGLVLAVVLTLANSALVGHTTSDPRILQLLSDGSISRIGACVLFSMVAAPLVEETLFRGLFAESLRRFGARAAIALSALAFAAWHLNPSALRYYALMGALLGWLYLRRGLLGSMAAHAAFNGTLTVVAIALVTGPGHVFTGSAGVSVSAPGDWSRGVLASGAADLALAGPSGSGLTVEHIDTPYAVTAPLLLTRFDSIAANWEYDGGSLDRGTARLRRVSAGEGLDVHGGYHGMSVEVFYLPAGHRMWTFILRTGGSVRAIEDFHRILPTISIPVGT